jgi:hypothetical protein
MWTISIIFIAISSLLSTNASPLERRQYSLSCNPASSCVTYSGTSIWITAGDSCPLVTPPTAIALATATPTDHPESCFYATSLDYCHLGRSAAMTTMSSLATAIYNAQSSGAVLCGATKTANLPVVVAASQGMFNDRDYQTNTDDTYQSRSHLPQKSLLKPNLVDYDGLTKGSRLSFGTILEPIWTVNSIRL